MDACDDVMRKIGKPEKLITHTSFNAVTEGTKSRFFTPRIVAYFGVFVVLFSLFLTLLFTRADVNTVILRQPGSLYNELPDDRVSNLYQVRFFNKTFSDTEVELRLLTEGGTLQLLGQNQIIPGQQQLEQRWMVLMDKSALQGSQTPIQFGVYKAGELIQTIETAFLGPINQQ
jgi:polyferredoxin